MNSPIRKSFLAAVLGLLLVPAAGRAELIRVEIKSRVDVLNGKAFGDTGPYEKIRGRHTSRSTRRIRATRSSPTSAWPRGTAPARSNSRPISSFSSPRIPSRGNGVVFFDVVNRGRFRLLSTFSGAAAADDPTTEAHFGDGSLLIRAITLVAVGWQFDVADELIGFDAPIRDQQRAADQRLAARVVHSEQGRVTRSTGPAATPHEGICRSISTPPTTG